MIFEFVKKDPDKAYISNHLWLPKALIREEPLKRALEFFVNTKDGQELLRLWDDSKYHIVCPREFIQPSQYLNYKFPFIDLRGTFDKVKFKDLVVPRNEEQEQAWAAFAVNNNGILNLGCGKGKTKLAVKKIAQRGTPTLVIVPDGGILSQWQEAILGGSRTPRGLEFDGELGLIQGPTFDWKHPITLALITSVALKIRDNKVPEEFFRYFGQVIYDEVHQLGAPVFSLVASPFYADRIGLTATVQREDGLDPIYRYHLGEPFYSDLKQDLVPRIYFWKTPAVHDLAACKINGMVNISLLRTAVGRDFIGNVYRYWAIQDSLKEGRKVLALSHSKDQLKLMHAMFPESAIIVSETPRSERTSILRNHKIVFAIARLGSQGVDDDRLDTLFWLTPFRSRIALQQSMGRIQRHLPNKKTPVMTVFEDHNTPPLKQLCNTLRTNLKEWGFSFQTLPPSQLPLTLPPEVKKAYDTAFSNLPERGETEDD